MKSNVLIISKLGGVQDAQQHHGLGDGGNDGGGEEGQGRGDNEHTQMMLDTARVELDKYKKKYENLVRKLRDKVSLFSRLLRNR